MNDWVTDPQAIETLLGLKELRPGDEVKLGLLRAKPALATIGEVIEGGIAITVVNGRPGSVNFEGRWGSRALMPLKKRIIAWRRPE